MLMYHRKLTMEFLNLENIFSKINMFQKQQIYQMYDR